MKPALYLASPDQLARRRALRDLDREEVPRCGRCGLMEPHVCVHQATDVHQRPQFNPQQEW